MKEQKLNLVESASRGHPVEENLRLWNLMQTADPEGLKTCLRGNNNFLFFRFCYL